MQPPPRKGGSVKFLKTLHAEQIAKLQVKNQTECELLEDLRSFVIKKASLERTYCESLLKIVSSYLNKKITATIPDLKTEGSDERWNMWSVWRTVLEENEKVSKAKLAAIELTLQQIADEAKILRLQKLQTTKKCVDVLSSIQKDVQLTVQDVEKTKKVYFDEEHCAHDVRDKAKDIENRLKRKKGSFFQSLSTLQKSSAKVSLKREQMDDKSVGARNDYLLSLVAANAHQTRYFVNDLQTIMQTMESNVYERVQEYFSLIGRLGLLTCAAKQASYSKIKEQAQKLTREYNLQCLYLYYPVLKQHIQYDFEACDGDSIDYITLPGGSSVSQFGDEVKDWLELIVREKRNIRSNSRKLQSLLILRESGEKTDPNDPSGPDIDTKIDELQDAMRKSEVLKVKTESKIELLKKSSDDTVREICKKLEEEIRNSSESEEEEIKPETTRPSIPSIASQPVVEDKQYSSDEDSVSLRAAEKEGSVEEDVAASNAYPSFAAPSDDVFKQFEASWDTNEDHGAAVLPESSTSNIYKPDDDNPPNASYEEFESPFKCVVLYNYTAQNPDELTIIAGEELDILGEGDGDGWLRARNTSGQEGFVPCTYLDSFAAGDEEIPEHGDGVPVVTGPHLTSQISFSSVDYTVTPSSVRGIGGDGVAGSDLYSDVSASAITTVHEVDAERMAEEYDKQYEGDDKLGYCIALYDYDTTEEGELPLREGQVVRILRKIVHDGIDDGWWEGEAEGRVGLFPSLMVQDCSEDGRPLDFDDEFGVEPMSAPPVFTPPEIPDHLVEDFSDELAAELAAEKSAFAFHQTIDQSDEALEKFSVEISDNQHKQYNTQFDKQSEMPSSEVSEIPPKGNTLPDISINVICDDDSSQNPGITFSIVEDTSTADEPPAESAAEAADNDFNLGVTQIVITAPTPSSDAADKSFPPDPAPDDSQMSVAAAILERRKSAGEINEADPPLYDPVTQNEMVHYPTTIIEESEEEEDKCSEENKQDKSSGESAQFAGSSEEGSNAGIANAVPPTYPNGVPEQLDTHQLQRLQQLKESNA